MAKDLQELPKLRDSMSYIYVEHAIIEQSDLSIVIIQADGRIPIPIASLTCLLIGPGTSITHAAIKNICENGCMAIWCGESIGRFYASGIGETRSSENLLLQAKLCMDNDAHLKVVRRMYEIRFPKLPDENLTIQQIRGMEGIRVRQAYKMASKMTGIKWTTRDYKLTEWDASDPINRALSCANSLLYSLCHAAIVSLGYSPALGFVHTGKMLSFVYDIGDLYKADTTIPAAFEAVKTNSSDLEREVRIICRRYFSKADILKRIANDIRWIFSVEEEEESDGMEYTGDLWSEDGNIVGGKNYGNEVK